MTNSTKPLISINTKASQSIEENTKGSVVPNLFHEFSIILSPELGKAATEKGKISTNLPNEPRYETSE